MGGGGEAFSLCFMYRLMDIFMVKDMFHPYHCPTFTEGKNIENKSFVHEVLFSFKHYLLVVKHVLYFLKGSHVKLFVSIFIQKCNILI